MVPVDEGGAVGEGAQRDMHVGGQAAVRTLDVVAAGERLDGMADVPVGVGIKLAAARNGE